MPIYYSNLIVFTEILHDFALYIYIRLAARTIMSIEIFTLPLVVFKYFPTYRSVLSYEKKNFIWRLKVYPAVKMAPIFKVFSIILPSHFPISSVYCSCHSTFSPLLPQEQMNIVIKFKKKKKTITKQERVSEKEGRKAINSGNKEVSAVVLMETHRPFH